MDIKSRLENVLHCYLQDEQVEYIKGYYKTFYENPEDYQNDGLIDIIIDDIGLTKIEPWSTTESAAQSTSDPWKIAESAVEVDIKKIFVNGVGEESVPASLAIGHVNNVPVYFRLMRNLDGFEYIGMANSHQAIASLRDRYSGKFGMKIVRIYNINNGYFIAYVYAVENIPDLQDVNECGHEGWEYIGDYPMCEDCKPACKLFVPFSEMSNGGMIPIMWLDTIGVTHPMYCSWLTEFYNKPEINEQDVHDMYNNLKEQWGSIDLEEHGDIGRYVAVNSDGVGGEVFIFNRNHVSRSGAVAHGMAIAPMILSKELAMAEPHHTSIYMIIETGSNGQAAYIALYTDKQNEQLAAMRESAEVQSSKDRGSYTGKEYLDNGGSRVQQLLNQGTGDYKEASSGT